MTAADLLDAGHLPVAGGLEDQAAQALDAIYLIRRTLNEVEDRQSADVEE